MGEGTERTGPGWNIFPPPGTVIGTTLPVFDRFHLIVAHNEGGHVSEEEAKRWGDWGGETMWGITEVTLRGLGLDLDPEDLTQEQAREIYREHYWRPVRDLCQASPGVALAVYDFGVNSGPRRAVRYLQRIVGTADDGIVGPNTIALVRHYGALPAILDLSRERRRMLRHWVAKDPRREVLREGLMLRVDRVERAAVKEAVDDEAMAQDLWRPRHI